MTMAFVVLTVLCILAALAWSRSLQRRADEQATFMHKRVQRVASLEERYRDLFENANDIIYTVDLEGNFTSLNKAGERLLGITRKQIHGKNISEIMVPESRDIARRLVERNLEDGEVTACALEVLTGTGKRLSLEVSSRLIYTDGKPSGVQVTARDITERQRTDTELRKLSRAVEQSPASVVITDLCGNIEYVNPKFTELTGYTLDEAFGKNPRILKSGEASPELYEQLWRTITSGGEWRGEFHNKKKNGELYWESAMISPVRDSKGVITHFVAVKEDTTERKRADEMLWDSEEKYRILYESSRDAIMTLSPPGWKFTAGNPTAIVLFGARNEGEFVAAAPWTLSSEYQPDGELSSVKARKMIDAAMERGSHCFEWTHKRLTGEEFFASVVLTRMIYRGQPLLHATVRDITEQKRAEEAMRESEEKFRSLVSNIPDVAWTVDADLHFVFISPKIERISGYTADEVYRQGLRLFLDSVHPDDLQRVREAFVPLFATGQPYDVECRLRRKNGEWIWVHDRALTTYEKNGIRYADGLLSDITERKHAEEALRQSNRALTAIGAVSQAVLRSTEEPLLLEEVCRCIVEHAGYRMAWVGFLSDGEAKRIDPIAQAGFDQGYLNSVDIRWDDSGQGLGPSGIAVRTRMPAIVRNTSTEASYAPWRAEATARGYASAISLPLLTGDKLLGVLNIYSTQPDAFDKQEEHLLTELTGNLAYGIQALRTRAERARAEEELDQSRRMLRSILDTIPQRVFWKDRNFSFLGCNKSLALDAGLNDPVEIIGRNDYELAWRESAERYRADDKLVMESETSRLSFDEPQSRPDGSLMWLRTSKLPLRDRDGRVFGIIGTYEDITERKQSEQLLQERESVLRAITDSAQEAILMMDPQGRVSFWNQAAERILGYAPDEALGRNLHELLAPERYLDAHRRQFPEFQRIGCGNALGKTLELHAMRKDGQEIAIALSLSAVQIKGGWNGVGILRDITEQKRAEMEIHRAKEAAETANRAKSEFLANMSHEIRTPMNGIIGMTELTLDTPLSSEQREYLTIVKESGNDLLTLINDILDYSKIEAGRLGLDPTEFNLHDLLATNLRLLAVRANQKGLELAYDDISELPERVIGDAGRLRQVIVNLVGNAIKFTDQGEVVVSVEVEFQRDESIGLHFRVHDTGIGIAPEKQQLIFEAFTQADSSMTRQYGGTGLGLTISSRLVQLMGGRIWVESVVGEGSTFHFTARMGQAKAPVEETARTEVVSLRDLAVLIVDDNSTNRKILDSMLKHWLMRPDLASDGKEGLAALERAASAGAPFPLVLIDAQMPGMDGFALAEQIKQNPKLAGATIMMLTSAGQRGDSARCRELGIAVYLIKPIRQSELLEAILAALGKSCGKERATVITRHTLRENRRKLEILLAEDNAVNQQLAVRLLEKRGHTVTVAGNGTEALAILQRSRFDLVLMDVQMPTMDGFQATAAIRKEEETTGKHLPIIAMTAHAMEGDRERCLAAGMDGYVAKPIKVEEFVEAVETPARWPEVAKAPITSKPRMQDPIDTTSALARVDGDVELLKELVALFLQDLPETLTSLRDAVMAGDAGAIERAAHKLKGSVGNFAAQPAFEAALKMEVLGRDAALFEAKAAYAELEEEIKRLKSAMAKMNGLGACA